MRVYSHGHPMGCSLCVFAVNNQYMTCVQCESRSDAYLSPMSLDTRSTATATSRIPSTHHLKSRCSVTSTDDLRVRVREREGSQNAPALVRASHGVGQLGTVRWSCSNNKQHDHQQGPGGRKTSGVARETRRSTQRTRHELLHRDDRSAPNLHRARTNSVRSPRACRATPRPRRTEARGHAPRPLSRKRAARSQL